MRSDLTSEVRFDRGEVKRPKCNKYGSFQFLGLILTVMIIKMLIFPDLNDYDQI